MKKAAFAIFLILILGSCNSENEKGLSESKKKIVVTTNIIYDAVEFIAGQKNEVVALMGEGVDPHLYKASQQDVGELSSADMIVYNGLHLEGKMIDILEKLSRNKEVISLGEGVPTEMIIRSDEMATPDPHIWFDAMIWSEAINYFVEELVKWDPSNADYYNERLGMYLEELISCDSYAMETLNQIAAEQRVLITAHDAFHYFGRAYDIEVFGLQGISTLSEYGLKDVSNLVDLIIDRNINAVFVESSVSQKALKSVVEGCEKRGHKVKIGGMLYSDAMGARSGPEGNYNGMFRYNVNTIYAGLK
jgi:manganese/zinc/iron transport system substrate-binding protein